MTSFAFLILCIQACLIQSVFTSCAGRINSGYGSGLSGYGASSLGYGVGFGSKCGSNLGGINLGANSLGAINLGAINLGATMGNVSPANSYGGVGNGEVFILGDLPVNGATTVCGQVPVMGLVQFNGPVPASGRVSITGSCGCGCGGY